MEFFLDMSYWHWIIFGLVLLALELVAPVAFFLWIGASALVTAVAMLVFPELSWQAQFLIFSVLSVFSIILSRMFLVKRQTKSDSPNLNRRGQQYVGRVFTLSESIEQGNGKIEVDDTHWAVRGPTLPKGSEVRVMEADGSVLVVEPVNQQA